MLKKNPISENQMEPAGEKRHQPKQVRGVETRRAILEAAAKVFAEKGYDQTTTHQIARSANISVGAIYRYFADKEAILTELYIAEVSGLRNRILEAFNFMDLVGNDVRNLVFKAIQLSFTVYSEQPALRRVFSEQSRKIPALAQMRRTQEDGVYQAVRQILASAKGVRLKDIEVGAYLITLFFDMLIEDFSLYRRKYLSLEENLVIAGAVDMVLRYVLEE